MKMHVTVEIKHPSFMLGVNQAIQLDHQLSKRFQNHETMLKCAYEDRQLSVESEIHRKSENGNIEQNT